ncbi:MAG: hypothetical protein V1750_06515, partial [Acidobacteriota bacterium]
MDGAARAVKLPVRPRREEVYRFLGYRDGVSTNQRTVARFNALWPQAKTLLAPRGAYRVVAGAAAREAGMPGASPQAAVGVCTIGAALEAWSAACAARGELLDALVLDAIGSAAAEAAADALNRKVCRAARALGLHAAPRISPGYGSWDVACQGRLLALLPAAELGVSLTSGSMMAPRKSVSFAAPLCEQPPADENSLSACERCGLVRCPHRRTGAAGPQAASKVSEIAQQTEGIGVRGLGLGRHSSLPQHYPRGSSRVVAPFSRRANKSARSLSEKSRGVAWRARRGEMQRAAATAMWTHRRAAATP